jgi:hypothetical protein
MRRIAAVLIGALCFVRGAAAQPPAQHAPPPRPPPPKSSSPSNAAPDLAFLEYLGSWQGDDDEWLAIKEWDQDGTPKGKPGDAAKPPDSAAKPKEPAPQGAGNDHDKAQ